MSDLRITGHSARVAGAMRMAYAGHPLWTIQVFGRWGSTAILGYVRDAILGVQGGDLARHTEEGPKLLSTGARTVKNAARRAVDNVETTGPKNPELGKIVVDMVLEQLRAKRASRSETGKVTKIKEDVQEIAGEIFGFAETELRLGRSRVVRSSTGVLHVAFNTETCLCGWQWALHRVEVVKQPLPRAGDTAGWCRRCHHWARVLADVS